MTGTASSNVHLPKGNIVRVRPARASDAPGLRALFFRLSDGTRYRFFGVGMPALPHFADRVVSLGLPHDPHAYALVAEVTGTPIGIARFDQRTGGCEAEIGLLIEDAWQHQGIGTRLLMRLAAEASLRAITHFTAHVIGENQRAVWFVKNVFPEAQVQWAAGVFDLSMCLSTNVEHLALKKNNVSVSLPVIT